MRIITTVAFCIALAGCGRLVPEWTKKDPNAEFYDSAQTAEIKRYLATKSSEPSVFVRDITNKFTEYNLVMPNGNRIRVCSAYGCTFKQIYRLSANTLREAKNKIGAAWGAEGEREGLLKALQHIEKVMGPPLGLHKDKKGGPMLSNADKGQMNATDEALNTTSIMMVMARYKILKYHDILAPEWKDGALWAVIRDRETGKKWGIDPGHKGHGDEMIMFDWEERAP